MNRLHHLLPHLALLYLPVLSSCNASAPKVANWPSPPLLRSRLEPLLATGQAVSTAEPVFRRAGFREVCARKQNRPLSAPEQVRQLRVAIEAGQEDGLQAHNYQFQARLRMGRRMYTKPLC